MRSELIQEDEESLDGWESLGAAFVGVLAGCSLIWVGGFFQSLIIQGGGLGITLLSPGWALGAYLWGKARSAKTRWALCLAGIVVPLAIYSAISPWVRAESLPSEGKFGLLWPWIWLSIEAAKAAWRLWKSERERMKHGEQAAP